MKIVVIGAGVLGVSTAWYLHQNGHEVTVIEKESEAARGTSYANGGYLQASITDPFNGPGVMKIFAKAWLNGLTGRGEDSAFFTRTSALPDLVPWGLKFLKHASLDTFLSHTVKNMPLGKYSVELLKKVAAEESINFSQSESGGLMLFRDNKSLDDYVALASHMAEHGVNYETLDRFELALKEPSLAAVANELVGAVYLPNDYSANCYLFCQHISRLLQQRGVNFLFNTSVQKIATSDAGIQIDVQGGSHQTDTVVIAAGNYSKPLAASLGIKLPISPIKGYSISVPMGDWSNRPKYPVIDMNKHAGVNPLGNLLRVAGTAELAGMKAGVSERRVKYLINLASQLYPEFAATIAPSEIDPWGGHRPISVDGLPMIGATPVKGVYVNTGHGGMGWSQAAGSAKALADLMSGAEPEIDISAFSISRFA